MYKSNLKTIFLLQLLLAVNSFTGIFSKLAANESFLSFRFCLYYGCIILLLGIYAIGWQQIIKRLPLTTAFANKAVGLIWGFVWGAVFFHEAITLGKGIGAILVVFGVVLFASADKEEENG